MNTRFDISKAPQLRAEPRHAATPGPVQSVPATPGGLVRSTLLAAGAAGAILVLFWLPAEYGIDPTGVGAMTGLTEMGEIKTQLAAEAEADAAAALAEAPVLTEAAGAAADPALVARLDRIDAQLATISALLGPLPTVEAAAPAADPAPEPVAAAPVEPAPEVVPEAAAAPADPVEAAVAEAVAPAWRDEVSYTLSPGEGIEVKLVMEAGQTASFEWTANGAVVNFDLHGDGGGEKISYEQGRGVPDQAGTLTAAFTGNHGWFWRNRTEAPVTVTLRTNGEYAQMKAP